MSRAWCWLPRSGSEGIDAVPAGDDNGPALLTFDEAAGELLLGFERDLEPRLGAGSGDLAHLAGWAAKLAGATCRLAALLHLAGHLRDGWVRPIGADTFAGAACLADYLVEHARAVFDLMGADPRIEDARWLLDWISRTNQAQFTRRDAHRAAPRGRFSKATDLDPTLALLEEHGWLPRVDADPSGPKGGRPPLPAVLGQPLAPRDRTYTTDKTSPADRFCRFWRFCGAWRHLGEPPMKGRAAVTLSNENGLSRFRACPGPHPASSGPQRAAHGRPAAHLAAVHLLLVDPARPGSLRWAR